MEWDKEPCAWCKRPQSEHAEPTPILDYNTNPPTPDGRLGRLCPVNGVTSQYWTPAIAMASPRWQTTASINGKFGDVEVAIEQSGRREPFADIRFVTGGMVFTVVGVKPKDLLRLAKAMQEADHYIRLCSE